MINNLVSYFNPDGTPTIRGLEYFRKVEGQRGRQALTPEDFGASVTASDNSEAFQRAINALDGETLQCGPGTYRFDAGFDIDSLRNVRIAGAAGGRSTVLQYTPSSGVFIDVFGDSHDFVLERVRIEKASPATANTAVAVRFTSDDGGSTIPVRPTIDACHFDGFGTHVQNFAGDNMNVIHSWFNRAWINSFVFGGFDDGSGSAITVSENRIFNTRISANGSGVQTAPQINVRSSAALRMMQVDITGGSHNLRVAENLAGDIPANVWCTNVIFGGLTSSHAVLLAEGVQNPKFTDCIFEAADLFGLSIEGSARNVDVLGGFIRTNKGGGLNIGSPNGTVSIKSVRISANNDGVNTTDEVVINNVASGETVIIQGCHIGEGFTASQRTARYGINVTSNMAGRALLLNNQIKGYDTSAINVSGSATGTVTQRDNDDLGP